MKSPISAKNPFLEDDDDDDGKISYHYRIYFI